MPPIFIRRVGWRERSQTSEARLRADECLIAAKQEGIAKEDIEEEIGDLVDYMSAAIAKIVKPLGSGPQITTDDDREQRIRTRAF